MDSSNRKTEQHVLALPLKINEESVLPVVRADSREELNRLIDRETVTDGEDGSQDWKKGSLLEQFVHPSTLIAKGYDPIQHLDLNDWYEGAKVTLSQQWDNQIMNLPVAVPNGINIFGVQGLQG